MVASTPPATSGYVHAQKGDQSFGFSSKLQHLAKTHRINIASTCEVVDDKNNILLNYVNTAEQRDEPFTKALLIQKWSAALKLLGIASRLPIRDVSAWRCSRLP